MAKQFNSDINVSGNVSVTDEVYGVTWDGSTNVPTKNAVYDKIENTAKMRMAQGSRATFIYDDFDRADATLSGTSLPTGQTWNMSGAGGAGVSISDGKMVGTDNYYASFDYGTTLTRVAGTFSFNTGAGTDRNTSSITLIADKTSLGLADMLHLIISPNKWVLQKRIAAGSFVEIASGEHYLRVDGTVYPVAMEFNFVGDTVIVIPPSGEKVTVVDTQISDIDGRYPTYQYAGDGTSGYKGNWHSVTAGKSTAQALRAEGFGISSADASLFYGKGLTNRKKITGTVTGIGWYRIANTGTFGTFAQAGNLKITASDGIGRVMYWDVDLSTYTGDSSIVMKQNYAHMSVAAPITQLRLSRDDVAFTIGLDMYVANADAMTYSIEFMGINELVLSPTVGATVLATANKIITFDETSDLVADKINIGNISTTTNTISSTNTNGNITLDPNGTGNVVLGNYTLDGDQTVGAGQDNYVLTYDNASGLISLEVASAGSGDMILASAQTNSGAKTFLNNTLLFRNPADTFSYTITAAAIAADRILNLPLLTGTDTLAVLDLSQTFTNKTINLTSNTLTGTKAQFDTAVSDGNIVYQSDALGTPSSGTLTNCTSLPASSINTGTLAGRINLGEGADTATIGLEVDNNLSADERYSGITIPGTAGSTIAFGDLCYLDVTAGEWLLADASAASTAGDVVLGICVDASVDAGATSMLLLGTVRSAAFPASIALGAPVWISETAGDITATAPTTTDSVRRRVGFAVTVEPNTIYFNPSNDYVTHI